MYLFLIPLLVGFGLNCASDFTAVYTQWWGERNGRLVCLLLRDVFGIPVWAVGLGLAFQAQAPRLFDFSANTIIPGWLLVTAGGLLILTTLVTLGRQAAAPSVKDTLVDRGVYAHIRHPIYSGMLLELAGLALLRPTQPAWLACALAAGWAFLQVRLEELDLVQRLPAYRDYMKRIPRFIPHLKHK